MVDIYKIGIGNPDKRVYKISKKRVRFLRLRRMYNAIYPYRIRADGVFQCRGEAEYYQYSKVENTFYRHKTILGRKLKARNVAESPMQCVIVKWMPLWVALF